MRKLKYCCDRHKTVALHDGLQYATLIRDAPGTTCSPSYQASIDIHEKTRLLQTGHLQSADVGKELLICIFA